MYNAPPLLKEKLPRLPLAGVANHKPPILGLTHGAPGSPLPCVVRPFENAKVLDQLPSLVRPFENCMKTLKTRIQQMFQRKLFGRTGDRKTFPCSVFSFLNKATVVHAAGKLPKSVRP